MSEQEFTGNILLRLLRIIKAFNEQKFYFGWTLKFFWSNFRRKRITCAWADFFYLIIFWLFNCLTILTELFNTTWQELLSGAQISNKNLHMLFCFVHNLWYTLSFYNTRKPQNNAFQIKTRLLEARPWMFRLPFKVYGAIITRKINLKKNKNEFFLNLRFMRKIYPPRIHKVQSDGFQP